MKTRTTTTPSTPALVDQLLVKALDAFPEVTVDGVTYSMAATAADRAFLYRYDEATGDHVLIARADITLAVTSC